jgi:hypothetical protein
VTSRVETSATRQRNHPTANRTQVPPVEPVLPFRWWSHPLSVGRAASCELASPWRVRRAELVEVETTSVGRKMDASTSFHSPK